MGNSPDSVSAPEVNLTKDINQYVGGLSKSLPRILNLERKYRKEFQGLNLSDISSFLQGTNGRQGIFGLSALSTQQEADTMANARANELATMQSQTGAVREMLSGMSPEAAAQVQRAEAEAQRAYAASSGLTPQEQRQAQQMARQSFGARGMLNSNASVVGEYMNRDQMLTAKRQEAAQRGNESFGYSTAFYAQPGLMALSSTPASYAAGQNMVQLGLGSVGAGTPQLYDIGSALNIGAAQRQNTVAAQSANAQSQAAYGAGMFGAIGSVVGGLGGGLLSAR
jgi:hypothetical protein